MSITLKKDVWNVRDPVTGNYRGVAILSTTLPQDAAKIREETNNLISQAQQTVNTMTTNIATATAAVNAAVEQGVDPTLTLSGIPADAAACGELKNYLYDTTGNKAIDFILNKFIVTSGSVGTTVNLSDIRTSSNGTRYAVIDVSEGDQFILFGHGGESGRLWCWIDSENKIISHSAASIQVDGLLIQAPENATKLIVHTNGIDGNSYYNELLSTRVEDIYKIIKYEGIKFQKFTYSASGGVSYNFNFIVGKTYKIYNESESGTINVSTRNGDVTAESIIYGLEAGEFYTFVPSIQADTLRIYYNNNIDNHIFVLYGDKYDNQKEDKNTEDVSPESKGYVKYSFPSDFSWSDNPLKDKVYTNGKGNFDTTFKVMDNILSDGVDVFVSPNGNDNNNGLSPSSSKATVAAAVSISNAKRVHIAGGYYARESITVSSDIDLIGDPNDRPVFTSQKQAVVWASTNNTGVYTTSRANEAKLYDLTTTVDGFYRMYSLVGSVSDVINNQGTYYDDGTTITLHTFNNVVASRKTICYSAKFYSFLINASGCRVLLANLCFTCGGTQSAYPQLDLEGSEQNKPDFLLYNCDSSYSFPLTGTRGGSAIVAHNANVVIAQNCASYHSGNDGFSWGDGCHVIEINCVSAFNGSGSVTSSNGSSSHGGYIIRINCAYHDTYGPVVHDIGTNESVNLGVSAWHSTCLGKPNFCASDGHIKMWLDSCVSYSSDRGIDVGESSISSPNAIIYKRNCSSDVEDGEYGGHIYRY